MKQKDIDNYREKTWDWCHHPSNEFYELNELTIKNAENMTKKGIKRGSFKWMYGNLKVIYNYRKKNNTKGKIVFMETPINKIKAYIIWAILKIKDYENT